MQLNKLRTCLLAVLALSLPPTTAKAVLCTVVTTQGKTVFMFRGGVATKTVAGTVAKLLPCKNIGTIEVRKEIVTEYVVPNPQNDCERTAAKVCDTQYGGIRLLTNPTSNPTTGEAQHSCLGLTISSGITTETSALYYAFPVLYSGMKAREDGSTYCVFDAATSSLLPTPVSGAK